MRVLHLRGLRGSQSALLSGEMFPARQLHLKHSALCCTVSEQPPSGRISRQAFPRKPRHRTRRTSLIPVSGRLFRVRGTAILRLGPPYESPMDSSPWRYGDVTDGDRHRVFGQAEDNT
jgi:hypothetical protein